MPRLGQGEPVFHAVVEATEQHHGQVVDGGCRAVQGTVVRELMGQLRDVEQTAPADSAPALRAENASLKRRLDQLAQEHRSLQERLEGARSNLRFADRRVADLEIQLLEQPQAARAAVVTRRGVTPSSPER
ncbi:hypothetical protein AB0D78_30365 [Streptomyces avermitilis]|uniref:hypothetical protein n=1 Tax=Streptomyces avermitilis TaxID=33903 RepID=UPI0033EE15E6